jgi:hypothetical protein
MKWLVWLVALIIVLAGLVGVVTPEGLLSIRQYVVTPAGLYAIAAVRCGIGCVLMAVSPRSRVPRTLRAVGALMIVAGVSTPLLGVERIRAILDWEAIQDTALLRIVAAMIVIVGGLLAVAVTPARRAA